MAEQHFTQQPEDGIHGVVAYYAENASARTAGTWFFDAARTAPNSVTPAATDVNKVIIQQDTGDHFLIVSFPITGSSFKQIDGAGIGYTTVADLDSPTELNSVAGSFEGELRVAVQNSSSSSVENRIYTFNGSVGSIPELLPLRVNASGSGQWKWANIPAFVGVPIPWYSTTIPPWALRLDGSAINATSDPELAAIFGSNLPDMRGEFIRGDDPTGTIDLVQGGVRAPLTTQLDHTRRSRTVGMSTGSLSHTHLQFSATQTNTGTVTGSQRPSVRKGSSGDNNYIISGNSGTATLGLTSSATVGPFAILTGGDAQTVPPNTAWVWIVRRG